MSVGVSYEILEQCPSQKSDASNSLFDGVVGDRKQAFETNSVPDVSDLASGAEVTLILVCDWEVECLTAVNDVPAVHSLGLPYPIKAFDEQYRVGHAQDRY